LWPPWQDYLYLCNLLNLSILEKYILSIFCPKEFELQVPSTLFLLWLWWFFRKCLASVTTLLYWPLPFLCYCIVRCYFATCEVHHVIPASTMWLLLAFCIIFVNSPLITHMWMLIRHVYAKMYKMWRCYFATHVKLNHVMYNSIMWLRTMWLHLIFSSRNYKFS